MNSNDDATGSDDLLRELDAWAIDFHLATVYDEESGTFAGRPTSDYQLVARIATTGPRTPDETRAILDSTELSGLLGRTWATEPPTETLRDQLAADINARDLLTLLDDATRSPTDTGTDTDTDTDTNAVVLGPASWFTGANRFKVERRAAHAASSDDAPLLATHYDSVHGLTVQARGSDDLLTITITRDLGSVQAPPPEPGTGQPATGDFVVAVETAGRTTDQFLAVLSARRPKAVLTVPFPDSGVATALEVAVSAPNLDLLALTDLTEAQRDILASIERSVRVCDGHTQRAWQTLARQAGPESALRRAVAAGLR